jgi:DNA modification methylase
MNFFNKNEIINIGQIPINSIINADCFDIMKYIKDQSIDLILCDLPYG